MSPRPSFLTPVAAVIPAGAVKLAEIADALAAGGSFNITRLTVLKSLCKNPQEARRFVAYILWRKFPNPDKVPGREAAKGLICRGLQEIQSLLTAPPRKSPRDRQQLFREIKAWQNETKPIEWGSVRIIKNSDLLLVEYALQCFLFESEAPNWAYQAARLYAERYDSRYGSGLIPESAPFVRLLADFWGAGSMTTLSRLGKQ